MIDWDQVAALREQIGTADFEEVVELFLEEVDAEIATLCAGTDSLAGKLHALKGSALNLGFEEFSSLCQVGETVLTQDPGAFIDIDDLHRSYQASRSEFLNQMQERFAN